LLVILGFWCNYFVKDFSALSERLNKTKSELVAVSDEVNDKLKLLQQKEDELAQSMARLLSLFVAETFAQSKRSLLIKQRPYHLKSSLMLVENDLQLVRPRC